MKTDKITISEWPEGSCAYYYLAAGGWRNIIKNEFDIAELKSLGRRTFLRYSTCPDLVVKGGDT